MELFNAPFGANGGGMSPPDLRPYQSDIIAKVGASIEAGSRRLILVAATGSGKTVIASALVAAAIGRGERVLFLAHRRELIRQTCHAMEGAGCGDYGVLLPGYEPRLHAPIQIASVATVHARAFRSRKVELPEFQTIIIDEAHHARAKTYQQIVSFYPNAAVIGLTATPCRGDGRGLGNIFEKLIECPGVAELIAQKHLVGTRMFAPSTPDLRGVRTERGDYVETELAKRVNTPRLVGDVVVHWLRHAKDRPTVVFATGVAHSLHIRDEFRRADIMCEHIDASTPKDQRDAILKTHRFTAACVDLRGLALGGDNAAVSTMRT